MHVVCFKKPKTNLKLTKKGSLFTPDGKADVYESEKVVVSKELEYAVDLLDSEKPTIARVFSEGGFQLISGRSAEQSDGSYYYLENLRFAKKMLFTPFCLYYSILAKRRSHNIDRELKKWSNRLK